MSSAAFATLAHHYAHRLEAAHTRGKRVVGFVGNTVPREVVMAAGFLPVLISAQRGQATPSADRYMEDVIAPETKALFELIASGELEFLDLLVLSRPYARLYYYLKEVYRLGRAPRIPPLHMFDLMHGQSNAVRAYNTFQLDTLAQRLGPIEDSALLDSAIVLTNRVRALQRELLAQRWQRKLSGVDALQAIGAGFFMPAAEYADALSHYLGEGRAPLLHRPRLLVLSSEPLANLELHQALESAGAIVVAEDDWWGSRAPGADIPPDGAILDKYWRDTAREAWFREHAARDEVEAVVFHMAHADRHLGWDYPRLKAWLDERGKRSFCLREIQHADALLI